MAIYEYATNAAIARNKHLILKKLTIILEIDS